VTAKQKAELEIGKDSEMHWNVGLPEADADAES
jgi:hypothetical protein